MRSWHIFPSAENFLRFGLCLGSVALFLHYLNVLWLIICFIIFLNFQLTGGFLFPLITLFIAKKNTSFTLSRRICTIVENTETKTNIKKSWKIMMMKYSIWRNISLMIVLILFMLLFFPPVAMNTPMKLQLIKWNLETTMEYIDKVQSSEIDTRKSSEKKLMKRYKTKLSVEAPIA